MSTTSIPPLSQDEKEVIEEAENALRLNQDILHEQLPDRIINTSVSTPSPSPYRTKP